MTMQGLMLDSPGSSVRTRDYFGKVTLPKRTCTYRPVPHIRFMDMIYGTAERMGLKVNEEEEILGSGREGQQLFGTVPVIGNDHLNNTVELMLGFRNSYDKSLSAGLCFGSQVFVCSNLCFTGYADPELGIVGKISHKHTTHVYTGLPERIEGGLGQFETFRNFQEKFFHRLKDTPVDDDRACGTLVRAAKQGDINVTDILDIISHWKFQEKRPEVEVIPENWHDDFQERNAWSLFNCVTEVHKKAQIRNFVTAAEKSMSLTRAFQHEFN